MSPESITKIKRIICSKFNLSEDEFDCTKRYLRYVKARSCYSHMLQKYLGARVKDIAKIMNKHHSCIIHYRNVYNGFYNYDSLFKDTSDEIDKVLINVYEIHEIRTNNYPILTKK